MARRVCSCTNLVCKSQIFCWTPLQVLVFYRYFWIPLSTVRDHALELSVAHLQSRSCTHFLLAPQDGELPNWYKKAVFVFHVLVSLNSAINPIIYGNAALHTSICKCLINLPTRDPFRRDKRDFSQSDLASLSQDSRLVDAEQPIDAHSTRHAPGNSGSPATRQHASRLF